MPRWPAEYIRKTVCPACGGRRAYGAATCNACCTRHIPCGPEARQWKGDAATVHVKRERARKLYALGPCQACGAPGRDRHHRDGDTGNNSPENIRILCRRCHMAEDGRLQALPHYTDGRRRGPRVTHCHNGHEYTPENTMRLGSGYRGCKQCAHDKYVRRAAQKREVAV